MLTLTNEKTNVNVSTQRHPVIIDRVSFKRQPKHEMGAITNRIKYEIEPVYRPLYFILEKAALGHSIMFAHAEPSELSGFDFISTSLITLDVDDDSMVTDPVEVMRRFKAAGLYYTFSHGIKGNRYRLVFQLDRIITDEREAKAIARYLIQKLKEEGVPVDDAVKNPASVARGGKGFELNDEEAVLNTREILDQVKALEFEEQRRLVDSLQKPLKMIPFETLREMAETIGHIPRHSGQQQLWARLVYGIKHYVNMGMITEDQGIELFNIISGGESTEKDWRYIKPRGDATINSLIHEAKARGYNKPLHWYFAEEEKFDKEDVKVDRYIPAELVQEWLSSKQKILVDSPTGSGKTTACMKACLSLEDVGPYFYIMAMPTVALAQQTAHKYGVPLVKGQERDLFRRINRSVRSGERVFVSTYDMTYYLFEFIKATNKEANFYLIIDEYHKTVYDFNYRREAIESLKHAENESVSVIGLSGTIDDIDKSKFDRVIRVRNNEKAVPAGDFVVYKYEKKKEWESDLAVLIKKWAEKRKLLVFLQSKERIKKLNDVLRKHGIKVRTVSANNKSNTLYKQLVEKQTVPEDVDVILATTVIADGVNILNNIEWEAIAVCNETSNLFNPSAIRQMANRFRNPYRRFSLFIQESKEKEEYPFHFEGAYRARLKLAKTIQETIQNHVDFDFSLFHRGAIERYYGIYPNTEEKRLAIDELFLRHDISNEQARHYMGNRRMFVKAVEKILGVELAGEVNISQAIRENNLETFLDELEKIENEIDLEAIRKAESLEEAFTPEVHKAFITGQEEVLQAFQEAVLPRHYRCIEAIARHTDYETCLAIVSQVKKDSQTHAFKKDVISLIDALYYQAIDRYTKTREAFDTFLTLSEFMTNDQWKDAISQLAKKLEVAAKALKQIEGMVIMEQKKAAKGKRVKRVAGPITAEYIAEKYGLPLHKVKEVVLSIAKERGDTYYAVASAKLSYIQGADSNQGKLF